MIPYALAALSEELSDALVVLTEVQRTCGGPLIPILCSMPEHSTSFGLLQGSIIFHAVLGHDEDGYALYSFGVSVHPGEHRMYDVGLPVMVACGYEDLLPVIL